MEFSLKISIIKSLILFCILFNISFANINDKSDENIIRVALILPLSGKFKKPSKKLLNAAILSWKKNSSDNMQLDIYDTFSLKKTTSKIMDKINKRNTKIIIGPLLKRTTEIINEYNKKNIPILSLSNKAALASNSIFITGFSANEQGIAISNAMLHKEFKNVVIVGPNNFFTDSIIQSFNKNSSEILKGIYKYNPGTIKFESIMENFKKHENIDAILLTENLTATIQTFVDQIKFYDINVNFDISVFGTLSWTNIKNIERRKTLYNSFFIDFNKDKSYKKIENEYLISFRSRPNDLDILMYELVKIGINVTKNSKSIEQTYKKLLSSSGFKSAFGKLYFNENGSISRSYIAKKISHNKLIPLYKLNVH